ncbi:type VI secretion system-associated protein TagF [Candidatus Pantoea multigeneris]|uniref:Type VI secretion system-associated protein TagF n=1 Tax=Candidatus Pantoea multigeneris TaxID=2608357 RepID=A0ABX0R765_9GAMM|nr:type VI secretion system-associated protein TagF [Pantoea multigeneris]NIF20233.1 type VI secretion system-associated protein TagF [Pantoea multigeneris]
MNQPPFISWYGKLPSAGDFLQRRFPSVLKNQWSQWFQVGMQQRQVEQPSLPFMQAVAWNFIVPPMIGSQLVQMGCVVPSQDSVGRLWPLTALCSFSPNSWSQQQLLSAGHWYRQLSQLLVEAVRHRHSPEQLDSDLLALAPLPEPSSVILSSENAVPLSWPLVAQNFSPRHYSSFWWSSQTDGTPLHTHVHSGNFTSQLFSLLFESSSDAAPGRKGIYKPMFE